MDDRSGVCWLTQKFSIALDTPALADQQDNTEYFGAEILRLAP